MQENASQAVARIFEIIPRVLARTQHEMQGPREAGESERKGRDGRAERARAAEDALVRADGAAVEEEHPLGLARLEHRALS